MNTIVLMGRLARDPETKLASTQKGQTKQFLKKWADLCKMWRLLYPLPYLAGGRRTEICWSVGTKTFTVFERISQNCISGSDDEWQTE